MLHASRVLGARVGAPLARRAARPLSDAAAGLQLSFSSPHTVFYFEQGVDSVTLPGVSGEYGVTSGHSPLAEQPKPGVAGDEPEKYFVSGGFAFTDDVKTEVSALEAIKLEDLDADKIKAEYSKVASAEDDESKLVAETTKAMAAAIGVTL
ncbi:proton-transporting ATP synthase [Aureococcus anophagefferens]|nr:proton-transporting ATP synthase [Aureococcus anophagefferens]